MPEQNHVSSLLLRKRESKSLDFKRSFDITSKEAWCELIKDIIAMANSGGGGIIIGVENNGEPSGEDVSSVIQLDNAVIMDKIKRYTASQSLRIEVVGASKGGHRVCVMLIGDVRSPLVFIRPGTYPIGGGRQESAFSQGTVYFRHGAKSEPADPEDLERFIQGELIKRSNELMANISKVVRAPVGHDVVVLPGHEVGALKVSAVPSDKVPKGASVIAVEDPQKYCNLTFTQLSKLTGINTNYLTAVIRELKIRDNKMMSYCIEYGQSKLWKYSMAAVDLIKKKSPSLDLPKLYRKHVLRRREE